MATINQSPAGQTTITFIKTTHDNINVGGGTPTRLRRNDVGAPSLAAPMAGDGGGFVVPSRFLLGGSRILSPLSAPGVFRLSDQITARRAGKWPGS